MHALTRHSDTLSKHILDDEDGVPSLKEGLMAILQVVTSILVQPTAGGSLTAQGAGGASAPRASVADAFREDEGRAFTAAAIRKFTANGGMGLLLHSLHALDVCASMHTDVARWAHAHARAHTRSCTHARSHTHSCTHTHTHTHTHAV